MKRSSLCFLFFVLLVSCVYPQTQKNTSAPSASAPKKPRSFIDRVLDFLSISSTSGALKGPTGEAVNGQVWVVDLKTKSAHALTSGADYQSPVFMTGSAGILALRGNDLVRIPFSGGEGAKLCSAAGIVKLVGAGTSDPKQVLVLLRNEAGSHPRVALLAIDTGALTELPYDPASSQDLQMVESLEGSSRVSGDSQVYVKRQSKDDLSGTREWNDVFLIAHGSQPVDVSHCDGVNCSQPSLSPDGNLLVYIKEKSE